MITITSPQHMTTTKESLLFYDLAQSFFPGMMEYHSSLTHGQFLKKLTETYDCEENKQNKAFLESAKVCSFLSVTRQIDNFQINF